MHRFDVQIADLPIQVVQARIRHTLAETFEDLRVGDAGRDTDGMALIVRLPVDESHSPETFASEDGGTPSGAFEALRGFEDEPGNAFQRVRNRPVSILHSHEGSLHLSRNVNPLFTGDPLIETGFTDEAMFVQIQNAELDALVARSRALLSSPPGSAFVAPSGNVVANFLRVGNIQCDRDAIDAIFFWLLPHLEHCAGILTDTWSISSIAYNVASLATSYFGGRLRRVEMLPGYNDASLEAQGRAGSIIERLVDDCDIDETRNEILVLISATQSGSLADNLAKAFNGLQAKILPRYVAIFGLGQTGLTSLRDLSNDPKFQFKVGDDIPMGLVEIDRQVYFPLTFNDVTFALGMKEAEAHREFFDDYAGSKLISVHRDDEGTKVDGRHHGIHLDVASILDHPLFQMRLRKIVDDLPMPMLVVASQTDAAQAMSAKITAIFAERGESPVSIAHSNLFFRDRRNPDENLARTFIQTSTKETELLIIDDVAVNAAHLSEYQKNLRTLGFKGRVHFVVGISRTANLNDWNTFAARLRKPRMEGGRPNTVNAVETITLPDLRGDECPWCQEVALYESWALRGDLPEHLADRRERLGEMRRTGMQDDLFLTSPLSSDLTLGPDSFYVTQQASQADVFAAAAAAIQDLRTIPRKDLPLLGKRRYPVATVLRWEDYITEKWTDSILRTVFLRAGHADELVFTKPETERDRTAALRQLLLHPSPAEHDVSLEILLAGGLGKVDLVPDDPMHQALRGRPDGELAAYMLSRLGRKAARI